MHGYSLIKLAEKQMFSLIKLAENLEVRKKKCCSMKPYIDQGWMENIPLYGVQGYIYKQIIKELGE